MLVADGGAALFAGALFYLVICFYEKIPRTEAKRMAWCQNFQESSPAINTVDADHVQTRDLSRTYTARVFTTESLNFFS